MDDPADEAEAATWASRPSGAWAAIRRTPRAPRAWTPDQYRARCLELIAASGSAWFTDAAPVYGDAAARGALCAVSVSLSRQWPTPGLPGQAPGPTPAPLSVTYDVARDSARCLCPYGLDGQPCIHAGMAIAVGRAFLAFLEANTRRAARAGGQATWE